METHASASGRNVLITGPSRSGTTLTCELLNQAADTVALDEPMNARRMLGHPVPPPGGSSLPSTRPVRLAARLRRLVPGDAATETSAPPDPGAACENIARFLDDARRSLLERGSALSRNVDGRVVGKKVADEYGDAGLRVKLAALSEISVDKELSAAFVLAIKQTSGFIALLPALVQRFEVFALVRNPLAVLTSWQTLPFHPQDGHVRLGEGIDWGLRDRLAALPDRIDRQFEILGWYYGRIKEFVEADHVIRYEEMVASSGRALQAVTPHAAALEVPMENRNRNPDLHDREVVHSLGARLLATDGPWWHYYAEEDVRAILPA